MRKKMYWGLASLILLIGVVAVYFILQPDPDPDKKYILPSETENKKATETNQPPPDASPNGHWHEDKSHDGIEVNIDQQSNLSVNKQSDNDRSSQGSVFETVVTENTDDKYALPDDVFSDAYTEKLKSLVQICVELYHMPKEIQSEHGYEKAWGGIDNARNDAQNIINHYFTTNDKAYIDRYKEIMKIIETYKALHSTPNTPMPESVQRLKELTPEMADKIDEIWRNP